MTLAEIRHRQILREQREWVDFDRRVALQEREMADIRAVMGGTSFPKTHIQRNHADHWESRYLSAHPGATSVPDYAYRSDIAARYCAASPRTCGGECVGCNRDR